MTFSGGKTTRKLSQGKMWLLKEREIMEASSKANLKKHELSYNSGIIQKI